MPQSITIDDQHYILVHTFPNTKPGRHVTHLGTRTRAIGSIYRHEDGAFHLETMEFFVPGFETAYHAQAHIDRVNIPGATVGPHDDGSFRVNIGRTKIHGFESEMQAMHHLHEINTPASG